MPWPSSTRRRRSRSTRSAPGPTAASGVGIIARVPLASGLLSGRYDENTLDPLGDDVLDGLRDTYDEEIREHVHTRW